MTTIIRENIGHFVFGKGVLSGFSTPDPFYFARPCGMTLAAGFRDVGRRDAGGGEFDGGDRVLAVAVGADGRIAHAGLAAATAVPA